MAANPIFPATVASPPVQFTSADTTVAKAIYTPTGTSGARVDGLIVSNNDTVAYDFQLFLRVSTTSYLIGTASIPANAGQNNNVQPVNLLAAIAAASGGPNPFPVDQNGNMYLMLGAGAALWAGSKTTITAAKAVAIIPQAGEY